jgi:hypothetical protein
MPDEEAIISKVQYLHRRHVCKCDRPKHEGTAHYPGRSVDLPLGAIVVVKR